MLVSLSALLAAEIRAVDLPASFLCQGLAVASSSCASLLEGRFGLVPGHFVHLVVDCALLTIG
jgi:hypothetical protein